LDIEDPAVYRGPQGRATCREPHGQLTSCRECLSTRAVLLGTHYFGSKP